MGLNPLPFCLPHSSSLVLIALYILKEIRVLWDNSSPFYPSFDLLL